MNRNILFFCNLLVLVLITSCDEKISDFSEVKKTASIIPDYTGIVIPSNIAPLNFYINESASKYHIEISSKNGDKIILNQGSPTIEIPIKKWHRLLSQNAGNPLSIEIYTKNDKWQKFKTITDTIAENIESYLAYRLINVSYLYWKKMGIYQRNLENFDQSLVYVNSSADENCVNCHSFCKADPNKMVMHFRSSFSGTIIKDGDIVSKINTKTKYTMSSFAYPAWHPSGKYVAFSVNLINQYFTADRNHFSEVTDKASDIVVYNIKNNTVTTSPKISTQNRENLPAWSPDGKWLYYISAPKPVQGDLQSRNWTQYALVRIPVDIEKNSWGDPDTLLSATTTNMSVSFPQPSPDGKYILFGMAKYGYFNAYEKNCDLYMMDIATKQYRKLENVNSESNDSYHSWSQNSRWIVFSSKRMDNLLSRTYFAYIDKDGKAHKPFIMPQKNPLFYNSFMQNYNRPELISSKIKLTPTQTRDLVYKDAMPINFDSSVDVDALSGATFIKK